MGGRRPPGTPAPGGGGYLSSRTAPNLRIAAAADRDARLDELRELGLTAIWIEVAESIGYDAFMRLWQILDREFDRTDPAPGVFIRVQLRRYSSYLRFQRNRYIESLADAGLSTNEIHRRLRADLCETVTPGHIGRIARRVRRLKR